MSTPSRSRPGFDIWPGFVDAMAQLLLVITFLLSVFMVAQFLLARAISGQDSALGQLRAGRIKIVLIAHQDADMMQARGHAGARAVQDDVAVAV